MTTTERIELLRGKLQAWLDEATPGEGWFSEGRVVYMYGAEATCCGNPMWNGDPSSPPQCCCQPEYTRTKEAIAETETEQVAAFIARARTITPAALEGYLALLDEAERHAAAPSEVTLEDNAIVIGNKMNAWGEHDYALRTLDTIEAAVREMEAA